LLKNSIHSFRDRGCKQLLVLKVLMQARGSPFQRMSILMHLDEFVEKLDPVPSGIEAAK
jgi:hypothetical protein